MGSFQPIGKRRNRAEKPAWGARATRPRLVSQASKKLRAVSRSLGIR